jgi:hypothetical protein
MSRLKTGSCGGEYENAWADTKAEIDEDMRSKIDRLRCINQQHDGGCETCRYHNKKKDECYLNQKCGGAENG